MSGETGQRGTLRERVDAAIDALKHEEIPAFKVLRSAGAIPPVRALPGLRRLVRASGAASIPGVLAHLHGDTLAIIDPYGAMTYREVATDANAATNGLRELLGGGEHQVTVGIMCRNSRYALLSTFAATGIGARIVFLNTDLGVKQLGEVCRREGIDAIISDGDFAARFVGLDEHVIRLVAGGDATGWGSFESLIQRSLSVPPPAPEHRAANVILTSGSSGVPKGALRDPSKQKPGLAGLGGFLQKIPIRSGDRVFLGPPVFHGWGMSVLVASLLTGATVVLDRRFDAARALDLIEEHRCTVIIGVPTMLRRLLARDAAELSRIDRTQLRVVASGGAKLEPTLVAELVAEFGPLLHNLYGASEASYITIATPDDLLAAPTCAGRAPIGVTVAIVRDGEVLPAGDVGEIYARSASQMTSYTNGDTKPMLDGMIATGDTGRLDHVGRLFIEGRADTMIVSGGENVFAEEVEAASLSLPGLADAKVVGIEDEEFGQRLRAFVVASGEPRPTEDEIATHIRTELSRSRVPRDLIYVDELPRTATGKVTRQTIDELTARYAQASSAAVEA